MALQNTRYGKTLERTLKGRKKLWFIGIGGVHMASIALWASRHGFSVAGSDRAAGEGIEQLQREGIPVYFGHDAARVVGYDAVIYTLAITAENPECNYSSACSTLGEKSVITSFTNPVICVKTKDAVAVNASMYKSLIIKGAKDKNYTVVNCMGEEVSKGTISADIEEINVPVAGMIFIG